jgi:four helix bundle protein
MNHIRTFEAPRCRQACRQLRLLIAKEVLPLLPKEEKYRLGDQMLRAARSSTANLAVGYGRFHFMDNAKFCSNARSSCREVLDHLITANDEGLIAGKIYANGRAHVNEAVKQIDGYMNTCKKPKGNDCYPLSAQLKLPRTDNG